MKASPPSALRASVTDDLDAMAPAWRELESRHRGRCLYASHDYVAAAWRHLRQPGDALWIVRVDDAQGRLQGVLPLWRRVERRAGLRLNVLFHPGILEGERPGLLAGVDPDAVWAAAWQALVARRNDWHRLEWREVDAGTAPLTTAASLSRADGWAVQNLPGHQAPYRPAWQPVPIRGADKTLPDEPKTLQVYDRPADMPSAWSRYEALESRMLAGPEAPVQPGTVQACAGAGALYRAWLPELAAQGRVQLAFWVDADGQDQAAWLRLLEPDGALGACVGRLGTGSVSADGGGGAWLERHSAWRPGPYGPQMPHGLWVQLQRSPWSDRAVESQCVHWPCPEALSEDPPGQGGPPHDLVRPTRNLLVWNLRSRVGPMLMLQQWMRRLRTIPAGSAAPAVRPPARPPAPTP